MERYYHGIASCSTIRHFLRAAAYHSDYNFSNGQIPPVFIRLPVLNYWNDQDRNSAMSYTNHTFRSSANGAGMSVGDGLSSSATHYGTAVHTSSPDNSGGFYAGLSGNAVALGDNTIAASSVSAAMVDHGSISTLDGSVATVAASNASGDNTAFASADTSADVAGAELAFAYTKDTNSTQQGDMGSVATATSATSLTAYDLHVPGIGDNAFSSDHLSLADSAPAASDQSGSSDASLDLVGNFASTDFTGVAIADNGLVQVDAFALAIDNELSVSSVFMDLAIS